MTAKVTLSMEIELGWGYHEVEKKDKYESFSEGRKEETRCFKELIGLCDDLKLPFTFAPVGHLFLRECDGNHEGPYRDDWFKEDPGTSWEEDPLFYAPDIIKMIKDADVDHEIGTHTFSHVSLDEVSKETLESEFEKTWKIYQKWGIEKPVSMIGPKHTDTDLKNFGIKVKRLPPPNYIPFYSYGKVRNLFDLLFRKPLSRNPKKNDTIVTYAERHDPFSAPFLKNRGKELPIIFKAIPSKVRQWIHYRNLKKSLDNAISSNSYIHYWAHLHTLANEEQFEPVKKFLKYLSKKIRAEETRIVLMKDLSLIEEG